MTCTSEGSSSEARAFAETITSLAIDKGVNSEQFRQAVTIALAAHAAIGGTCAETIDFEGKIIRVTTEVIQETKE